MTIWYNRQINYVKFTATSNSCISLQATNTDCQHVKLLAFITTCNVYYVYSYIKDDQQLRIMYGYWS